MGWVESVGVLVGSDQSQEWLLDWFYHSFRKYNPVCPIAFADFGMSEKGKRWCEAKGERFQIPKIPILQRAGLAFEGERWEEWKLDKSRLTIESPAYFRKPAAILQSPFERTLWLDLDCQILGNLNALLSLPLAEGRLAAAPCGSFCYIKNLSRELVCRVAKYNTGVILTEKKSPLLEQWASLIDGTIAFCTDEGSLSFLADRGRTPITKLNHVYNWPVYVWGENAGALIYHWLGEKAKCHLKKISNTF